MRPRVYKGWTWMWDTINCRLCVDTGKDWPFRGVKTIQRDQIDEYTGQVPLVAPNA